jgi:thioredoxin 1
MGHFGKCSSGACPLTANPYRGAIYGGVMGALFALSFAGQQSAAPQGPESSAVVHVASVADFEKFVLNADKPCLADFYSNNCGPCRRLSPTISKLADKYAGRAVVCKVSLDEASTLSQPYGVRSIPAVLFFKDGKEVERIVGLRSQGSYEKALEAMLKEPSSDK